jgi:hypothetical protein
MQCSPSLWVKYYRLAVLGRYVEKVCAKGGQFDDAAGALRSRCWQHESPP